jgi:hypothetical protein
MAQRFAADLSETQQLGGAVAAMRSDVVKLERALSRRHDAADATAAGMTRSDSVLSSGGGGGGGGVGGVDDDDLDVCNPEHVAYMMRFPKVFFGDLLGEGVYYNYSRYTGSAASSGLLRPNDARAHSYNGQFKDGGKGDRRLAAAWAALLRRRDGNGGNSDGGGSTGNMGGGNVASLALALGGGGNGGGGGGGGGGDDDDGSVASGDDDYERWRSAAAATAAAFQRRASKATVMRRSREIETKVTAMQVVARSRRASAFSIAPMNDGDGGGGGGSGGGGDERTAHRVASDDDDDGDDDTDSVDSDDDFGVAAHRAAERLGSMLAMEAAAVAVAELHRKISSATVDGGVGGGVGGTSRRASIAEGGARLMFNSSLKNDKNNDTGSGNGSGGGGNSRSVSVSSPATLLYGGGATSLAALSPSSPDLQVSLSAYRRAMTPLSSTMPPSAVTPALMAGLTSLRRPHTATTAATTKTTAKMTTKTTPAWSVGERFPTHSPVAAVAAASAAARQKRGEAVSEAATRLMTSPPPTQRMRPRSEARRRPSRRVTVYQHLFDEATVPRAVNGGGDGVDVDRDERISTSALPPLLQRVHRPKTESHKTALLSLKTGTASVARLQLLLSGSGR